MPETFRTPTVYVNKIAARPRSRRRNAAAIHGSGQRPASVQAYTRDSVYKPALLAKRCNAVERLEFRAFSLRQFPDKLGQKIAGIPD